MTGKQISEIIRRQKVEARAEARWKKLRSVISKFKPARRDRGKIVLLGQRGSRIAAGKNRKVIAIYVNSKGKKTPVRQYDRETKKIERFAKLRKVHNLDVSRVRSKRAQKTFLTANLNRIAAGTLSEIPQSGRTHATGRQRKISCAGTRYCGSIFSKRIDRQSEAARKNWC